MKNHVVWMVLLAILVLASSSASSQIEIDCPFGSVPADDSPIGYANSVAGSHLTVDPGNSIGAEDDSWATISKENGSLILDMGDGEEIFGSMKIILKIASDLPKDWALIEVSNNLSTGWALAGVVLDSDNNEVSILGTGYDYVRYVKITNPTFEDDIRIDAVKAKCVSGSADSAAANIPEFSTIATFGIIVVVGLYVHRKRH